MSSNINQIYINNPASTLQATDLFYLGRSPYSTTNDMACKFSTILSYIPSANYVDVTSSMQTLANNTMYCTDNGILLVTYILPTVIPAGGIIDIVGKSSGLWTITQNSGQFIHVGNVVSTTGTGGSVSSQSQYDSIRLVCITANIEFNVISGVCGNLTVV